MIHRTLAAVTGGLVTVVLVAVASRAVAQGIGANAAQDAIRFTRMVKAVHGVDYANAVVVDHGAGMADAVFVLTATTRSDSAVLIAAIEPDRPVAHPMVLERGRTPADMGIGVVEITPFLGARDLIDIEVSHRPVMLETSRTFAIHHIVQRSGETLTPKCDFDGSSSSSSSKGIGSMTSVRSVTIEPVPGQPMAFLVTVIEKTIRQQDREPATTYDDASVTRRYELQPAGTCRVLKPE